MKKNLQVIAGVFFTLSILSLTGYKVKSQPGPNLARAAIVNQSGSWTSPNGPSNYNDGIICGGITTCYGQVTTAANPDPNAWIEYDWSPYQVQFDQIIVYLNSLTQYALNGATIQIWNGTTYVNWQTYNIGTPSSFSYTVKFRPAITSKLRLANLNYYGSSSPRTEEIEVRMSTLFHTDAGITLINRPAKHVLPGANNVASTLMNFGIDTLVSTTLKWSVDGAIQSSSPAWTGKLATLKTDSNLLLGSYNFTTGIHTIKSWTTIPNGKTDSNYYNDTFRTTIFACNPITGTYVIDLNGSGDFKTFNDAYSWVKTCGMSGPVKFRVKPGSYTEQLSIANISGLSRVNSLTFESYTLDSTSVNLNYNSNSMNSPWVVQLTGTNHVTFRKMTIQSTGSTYACAVNICDMSDSNTFINDVLSATTGNSSYFYVVRFGSFVNGNTLDEFNLFQNNLITGGYYGVYAYGPSSSSMSRGNIFDGNTVNNYYYYGIMAYYQDGFKVTRCSIVNSPSSGYVFGIYAIYVNNGEISYNKLKLYGSSYVYALYLYYLNYTGTVNGQFKVFNNFVSGGSSSNSTVYGIYCYYSSYVDLFYNSVCTYNSTTSNYTTYFYSPTSSGINLKNNIFSNFSGGYAIYMGSTSSLGTSDYNDLYTSGSTLGYWSSACPNLASWQTASSKDAKSVSVDPGFYSVKDLHVNTSAINGKGTPVTGITDDIDKDTRSASTPDIGADEFNLITNDAGITDIFSPLAPCPGSNPVTVKVKNFGTALLSTVKVNWTVNGVLQTPATITPTLIQYQETSASLGSYIFSTGTSYKLKFWTTLPNGSSDGNTLNDTFNYTVIKTAISGTFTIGATGSDYKTFNDAVKDLINSGVCGPVKFRVRPGNYFENITIPNILGTSSTNTVTFESFNLDSTTVDLNYSPAGKFDNYVIKLLGASYITFREMKIRNSGNTDAYIVYIAGGSNYNTFTNNIVTALVSPSSSANGCFYSDNSIDNYNSIMKSVLTGGYYSVYFYGASSTSLERNNVLLNNVIKDFTCMGVYSYYQSAPLISGNYIENSNFATSTIYGIYLYYNFDSLKVIKNKIIVHGPSSTYGIMKYYSNYSSGTIYGLVANNFISVTGNSTSTNYGLYDYYSYYQYIYNNNINVTTQSGVNGYAFYISPSSNIYVANNIFVNTGGGYTYYAASSSGIVNTNYNDLYETGGAALAYWNGTTCANLAAWKASAVTETKSISANPYFTSPTDLHVYSKALDSTGSVVPQVKDDIDNEIRNTKFPDIGADEFRVLNYDAAIVSLIAPIAPCPGLMSSVIIRLRNYGQLKLTSTKVKWTINGVAQPTYYYSGTLLNLKDTALVLGPYAFFKGTKYVVKIWVDSVNGVADFNHSNDSLILPNLHTSLTGTYTIGSSGRDYPSFTAAANDLLAFGVCSSVTFLVDSGIYYEHISLTSILGASATHTITFRSAKNDSTKVILNYSASSSSDNYVIQLMGVSYLRFEKLTIKAAGGAGYAYVVDIRNSSNYNIFRNNIMLSTNAVLSGSAEVVYSPNGGSSCNYNIFENNIMREGYYSIYFYGASTTSPGKSNVFRNNKIFDFYYYGIMSYYQDSIELNGNILKGTGYYGMYCYYLSNSCNIINNQIYLNSSNTMYGIYMYYCTGKLNAYIMCYNNFISLTGSSTSSTVYGIYNYYCYYNRFYHNSIYLSCGATASSRNFNLDSPSSGSYGNIEMQNNILCNTAGGYAIYVSANAVTLGYLKRSNYNDIYCPGAHPGYWGSADAVSLINWQSMTGQDPKSFSLLPAFVSVSDLHLTTYYPFTVSNYLSIKTDIDGELRSTKTPVVGADEKPILPYDAGITGITSPARATCDGIIPVTANLYNYGTNELDSVFIDYLINGVVQRTIKWKGKLSYYTSASVSLGLDTFTAGKLLRIKIRTRLPNGKTTDTYTFNDADSIDVRLFAFPVIKSVAGDTICKGSTATLRAHSDNTPIFEWYDSIVAGKLVSVDSVFITGPLNATKTYYVNGGTPGSPNSLTTSTTIVNAEMGNMMDVKALLTDIIIDSFAVQPVSTSLGIAFPVVVYYKNGTYKGYETNPSAWTLLGVDTVISNGSLKLTNVTLTGLKIKKGQTMGLYISSADPGVILNYTDGAKAVSDINIQINTGTSNFYPFDPYGMTSNRTWNGTIFYETGSLCRSARVPVNAVVIVPPKPNLGKDSAFCKGIGVNLNAGAGPGYTYDWRYGSSPKTISTKQIITVDSNGKYTVIVTDTKCSNTGSDTITLTAHSVPDAAFTVNYLTHCLWQNAFSFTNHSTIKGDKISKFRWDFGDGNTKPDSCPVYSYIKDGTFTVKQKVYTNFGCMDSFSALVTVYPQPFTLYSLNKDTQCLKNNLFVFTNKSTINSGSILLHAWAFGDGATLSTKNSSHKYLADGSYDVSLVEVSNMGCTDTLTTKVYVAPQPKAGFTVADSNECFKGNLFVFTNTSTIKSGTMNYSWNLGDATILTTTNCNHSYSTISTYSVILAVTSESGCTDSAHHFVYLKPNPTVNLGKDDTLFGNQTVKLDAGSGYTSYLWSNGSNKQQITVDSNGIGYHSKLFWVTVVLNGCSGSDTIVITFKKGTGIYDPENLSAIRLYPNPATNSLNIEISGEMNPVTFELFDSKGIEYNSFKIDHNSGRTVRSIDISKLAKGVYFVKITGDEGIKIEKLIKY